MVATHLNHRRWYRRLIAYAERGHELRLQLLILAGCALLLLSRLLSRALAVSPLPPLVGTAMAAGHFLRAAALNGGTWKWGRRR